MHTYQVAQDADDKMTFNLLNPSPGPITPLVPMNYSPTERKLLSRSCPVMTEVYEAEAIALLGMTPLGAWLKVHGDRYDPLSLLVRLFCQGIFHVCSSQTHPSFIPCRPIRHRHCRRCRRAGG